MSMWDLVRGGYEGVLGGWTTVGGLSWAANPRRAADASLLPRHLASQWHLDMTWWRLAGLVIVGTGLTVLGLGLDHLGVGLHRLLMLMAFP